MTGWSIRYRGSNITAGFLLYRSVVVRVAPRRQMNRTVNRKGRPPRRLDWSATITEQTLDEEFWTRALAVMELEQDQVSGLSMAMAAEGMIVFFMRGNILGYEEVKARESSSSPARKYLRSATHVRPDRFQCEGAAAFYELHLKGKNTAFMEAEAGAVLCPRRQRLARRGAMAPNATLTPYYAQ